MEIKVEDGRDWEDGRRWEEMGGIKIEGIKNVERMGEIREIREMEGIGEAGVIKEVVGRGKERGGR